MNLPVPRTPSAVSTADAAANLWDMVVGGGVADLTPMPRSIIAEAPQRTIYRYRPTRDVKRHSPVLLVPPLAAPATCFDLRRGCSVAEHLTRRGYPTYLVDYGAISWSDRELGLEHWVEDVIPAAIREVSEDAGDEPVQVVGWCLGGIMALLSVAAERLPVSSVALIASPFDFSRVRLMAPFRRLAGLTGGAVVTGLYRMLGGAPAPLVSLGFQLTAIDKRITKPIVLARHLSDRDFLAHVEAVDDYMGNMLAYPGRTFGQLYHRFFRVNELAGGKMTFSDRTIDLAKVRVPVLSVAGRGDVLAPRPAVHHVAKLLPNAPEVLLESAPGGHLGVLTGRSARRTTWVCLDEFLARYDRAPRALAAAA